MRHVLTLAGCVLLAAPASAQIVRASVSTAGMQANGPSSAPGMSANGRFIVFASDADNLVASDTNGATDVFLHDRDSDGDGAFDEAGGISTTRLSVGPHGLAGSGPSTDPVITPDGRYVCFVSRSDVLASFGTFGALQIYRLDRTAGTIIRVSVDDTGVAGDLDSTDPVISDDGNVVAFASLASTLVPGAATPTSGIFVREITAGRTTRLSPPGPQSENAYYHPTISADGRFVLYQSSRVVRPLNLPTAQLFDRVTGVTHPLDATFPLYAQLSTAGTHAFVRALEGLLRLPVDLPVGKALVLPNTD
ncbi:MAG: hypothetical protein ABIU38_00225, partial [Vicinamibacteraceae bacterium]